MGASNISVNLALAYYALGRHIRDIDVLLEQHHPSSGTLICDCAVCVVEPTADYQSLSHNDDIDTEQDCQSCHCNVSTILRAYKKYATTQYKSKYN